MRVISLGWGVQSFTLAVMAALGDILPVDAAIHADTTRESLLTYQFANRWTDWLTERGVKIITVTPTSAEFEDRNKLNGLGTPPVYSLIIGDARGYIYVPVHQGNNHGQLLRSCTQRWKIAPIRRWLQLNRNGEHVDQLIGISLDEAQRMRDSDVKYITNIYPLVDMRMTRAACVTYLERHRIEIPEKSACYFCLYHSQSEWRKIKQTPEDWEKAVEVDRKIRKARPPYDLYLHSSRKPLEAIDLSTPEERGQLSLWDNECSGICGV